MIASIFILLFSVAALIYWLRYTVLSILGRERAAAEAAQLAEANRLEFPQIRRELELETDHSEYERLGKALRHDFLALTYLLRYAATVNVGRYSREERLLVADFYLMRAFYTLARFLFPRSARFALMEMAAILEYFAGIMGRRMASFSLDLLKV